MKTFAELHTYSTPIPISWEFYAGYFCGSDFILKEWVCRHESNTYPTYRFPVDGFYIRELGVHSEIVRKNRDIPIPTTVDEALALLEARLHPPHYLTIGFPAGSNVEELKKWAYEKLEPVCRAMWLRELEQRLNDAQTQVERSLAHVNALRTQKRLIEERYG